MDRGHLGRTLLDRTLEARQEMAQGCRIHGRQWQPLEDLTVRVIGARAQPELDRAEIRLLPAEIRQQARRRSEGHRQHARDGRIQGSAVANPTEAIGPPHVADAGVGTEACRLVEDQKAPGGAIQDQAMVTLMRLRLRRDRRMVSKLTTPSTKE